MKQRTPSGPNRPKSRASRDGIEAHQNVSGATPQDMPPNLAFLKRHQGTLPETISTADLIVLNAGLHFLFQWLREARRKFEQEGDAGRSAASTALGAFWQFVILFERPLAETLHTPILRLQDALVSLDKNSVLPIVAPSRRRGRGRSSEAHLALKGHVAGTVRRLVLLGLDQPHALKKVAVLLHGLGVRAERGPGHVTAGTVRNWCNEVSADVSREGTAALVHDDMFSDVEERRFATLSPADARSFALASLSGWVRSLFPQLRKAT